MRSSDWSSDVCSSDLDVGGALHVVVAAEDVGTAARHADHAHREPENAVGPGVAAAGVVLGGAHAPADGERAVVGQRPCDALHLGTRHAGHPRSEEHTSELQSLMRISYAVFCLKKKK